jgi:hypothetical protein
MIPRHGFDSPLPKGQGFLEWRVSQGIRVMQQIPHLNAQLTASDTS